MILPFFPPKKRFANTFGIELIHKIVEYAKTKGRKEYEHKVVAGRLEQIYSAEIANSE